MQEDYTFVQDALLEELVRNRKMRFRYLLELQRLPEGDLVIESLEGVYRCYLSYHEDEEVISECLGIMDGVKVSKLKEKIEQRKHIENIIYKLLREEEEIREAIG